MFTGDCVSNVADLTEASKLMYKKETKSVVKTCSQCVTSTVLLKSMV